MNTHPKDRYDSYLDYEQGPQSANNPITEEDCQDKYHHLSKAN